MYNKMKILLLLVFLLCKESKASFSEQSAGSGDFSDTEEDENKTETTESSDDEYDVYYVNRLFFFTNSPTPSYLEIIVLAQQADPGGKMPLLPDLDLKTGKFIFFSGKCLHFFYYFFFSISHRVNGSMLVLHPQPEPGAKRVSNEVVVTYPHSTAPFPFRETQLTIYSSTLICLLFLTLFVNCW